jgi:NADH:ubiquinone oxidoreductase subunit F (NADH-binding)
MIKSSGGMAVAEKRVLLKNCGQIDPEDIRDYEGKGGFEALKKAREMTPEGVIQEIKASGLRGRGGAGFPCGVKWELTGKSEGDEKYLICNADEGEVGTFKDRYIMQHDPFRLIEGMIIAAYGIGAKQAFIYLRSEYHYLNKMLQNAIDKANEKGYLNGLGIEILEGAGAYICGEESALMNSIEGKRGEVRYRPPFPPERGLFGKPTIINNVETLVNVPIIILNGAQWYGQLGTEESKGTKVFSVSGDVSKPGIYELEMGSSVEELVVDLAGATEVKMVQVGGSTGGIVPGSMLSTPLSYETLLGSGAVVVFDESRDVIDFVYRTMEFLSEESCGKCTPCREGTEVMVEILGRLVNGEGVQEDITALEALSRVMMDASMCGLGQTAPIPVMDTLKYFRNDYENRIKQSVFLRSLRTTAV